MGQFFHKKVQVRVQNDRTGKPNERAAKLVAEHGDKFWVLDDTNNVFLLAPENVEDLYRGAYNLREISLNEVD